MPHSRGLNTLCCDMSQLRCVGRLETTNIVTNG
nr:MAG TPA: hypothetical protein [Caudoviricetes sp.]